MLKHLSVRNYALIRDLDIDFHEGLNIITGETGAGKSILLGALGLVLGQRSDSSVLEEKEKCVIEAEFLISGYALENYFEQNDLDFQPLTILRRELSAQGKSRAFVNDTPVSLSILKELGEYLVDIHGQHDTLSLRDKYYQLDVLDTFAHAEPLLTEYKKYFYQWKQAEKEWKQLSEREALIRAESDFNRFQLAELTEAALVEGEEQSLENELDILSHAAEITQASLQAAELLTNGEQSVTDAIRQIQQNIRSLIKADKRLEELNQRLESVYIEVKDMSGEFDRIAENTPGDEQRLESVQQRLSLIQNLLKKHRVSTVNELVRLKFDLEDKLAEVEQLDESLDRLLSETEIWKNKTLQIGEQISELRRKVCPELEQELSALLRRVGMPNAAFKVEISNTDTPGESGLDEASILFSSNLGSAPQPISKVASGGELSRVMLCIKSVMAGNRNMPTLIFDEIDTGISGEIAQKVGSVMKTLSQGHQVFSVTHLPQIAAAGKQHYLVYKEIREGKTTSSLRLLSEDERVMEIARMLSGESPGASAVANARELMTL